MIAAGGRLSTSCYLSALWKAAIRGLRRTAKQSTRMTMCLISSCNRARTRRPPNLDEFSCESRRRVMNSPQYCRA